MDQITPLWAHQNQGVERAKSLDHFAYFFDPGTGKSGTVINTLRWKMLYRGRLLRTLILCPPIVVPNWKDEWAKHSKVSPADILLLTGPGKKRQTHFLSEAYVKNEGVPKIVITNYESLLMDGLYKEFQKYNFEAIVFDESQRLKSRMSKRAQAAELLANPWDKAAKAARPAPLKYLLSGSPVLNSPMDLFQQFLIMDGGATFGDNFWAFQGRFFTDKNQWMKNSPKVRHFPDWVVKPGAVDEINQLIASVSMRVEKKNCLDLPPMVYQVLKVGMSTEQARLYKDMKQDLIAFIGDAASTGPLALTKAIRLQQIASGYIKTVDGDEVELESTPKQEALTQLLEELTPGHKVLVWSVWRQNYAQIRHVCDRLKIGYVEIHGGITPAQKQINLALFRSDPLIRVVIGHPGSGGIGVNMVEADYSIWYSRSFSLEESEQAEARNYRGGSKEQGFAKITRIDLVTAGTIEEPALAAVKAKKEMSLSLLREIKTSF